MAQKNEKKKLKKFQKKPKVHNRDIHDESTRFSENTDSDAESSGSGFEEVSSNHRNAKNKVSTHHTPLTAGRKCDHCILGRAELTTSIYARVAPLPVFNEFRVPTAPGKPGKIRVTFPVMEISWNF